jgi:SAM-dependent methyltransferase
LNQFILEARKSVPLDSGQILEIGSQGRSEVQEAFSGFEVKSFDIVDDFNPDYVGDITRHNHEIPDESFDAIACLEILEHTLQPFDAIVELRRMLKDGGYLLISAPLNFRIHGPVPDCWRFTEFGWRILLKDFDILRLDQLETPGRPLFPIKYNILARCNKDKAVDARSLQFERI